MNGLIPWLILIGWPMGIFLNLCADSLPLDRRLHRPSCPGCGQPRPPIAWSGLVAWLSGRRACPPCHKPLPIRHLLVEVGVPLAYAMIGLYGGNWITLLLNLLYSTIFILVLLTDLEHRLIPHVVMLPSIALAIVGAWFNPAIGFPAKGWLGGVIGLLIALGLYWLGALFARWMGKMRGKPVDEVAFGFGDVTLITFIGLIVGPLEIIFALLIGLLSGGLAAITLMLSRGKKYTMFTAIPYGPFLVLGGVIMLYFGAELITWYMGGAV